MQKEPPNLDLNAIGRLGRPYYLVAEGGVGTDPGIISAQVDLQVRAPFDLALLGLHAEAAYDDSGNATPTFDYAFNWKSSDDEYWVYKGRNRADIPVNPVLVAGIQSAPYTFPVPKFVPQGTLVSFRVFPVSGVDLCYLRFTLKATILDLPRLDEIFGEGFTKRLCHRRDVGYQGLVFDPISLGRGGGGVCELGPTGQTIARLGSPPFDMIVEELSRVYSDPSAGNPRAPIFNAKGLFNIRDSDAKLFMFDEQVPFDAFGGQTLVTDQQLTGLRIPATPTGGTFLVHRDASLNLEAQSLFGPDPFEVTVCLHGSRFDRRGKPC